MMHLLTHFAAFAMASTVLLSLLPEGGMKRTAGMAVGLLILLSWAEGIGALLNIKLTANFPASVLTSTMISLQDASSNALAVLQEVSP